LIKVWYVADSPRHMTAVKRKKAKIKRSEPVMFRVLTTQVLENIPLAKQEDHCREEVGEYVDGLIVNI